MDILLDEAIFEYISSRDKTFIRAFDNEMVRLGFSSGGKAGPGYCWGNHMIIYNKVGVKSKNSAARIYLRKDGIVLRMYLNKVDQHRAFIENAPAHIKSVFTGEFGACRHDRDDGDGSCMFRKIYTIDGRTIEKCNGETFWFFHPTDNPLEDYMALFEEFFPRKKRGKHLQPAE